MPNEDWKRYLEKSVESLLSAEIASRRVPKMCNCAANRAYYAAYLAELAAIQKIEPLVLPAEGWQHPTVVRAFNHRLIRTKGIFKSWIIEDVSFLETQRVQGDYKTDHVSEVAASECFRKASKIVATIKKELEK